MLGLDPQECRNFATILNRSSHLLNQTSQMLNGAITRTGWQGPDSASFRARWPQQRTQLLHAASGLEDAAKELLRNVAEQERTSSTASLADGGSGGGVLNDLLNAGKDLWDDVTDGASNVLDATKDGLDWLGNTISVHPSLPSRCKLAGQPRKTRRDELRAVNRQSTLGSGPSGAVVFDWRICRELWRRHIHLWHGQPEVV